MNLGVAYPSTVYPASPVRRRPLVSDLGKNPDVLAITQKDGDPNI